MVYQWKSSFSVVRHLWLHDDPMDTPILHIYTSPLCVFPFPAFIFLCVTPNPNRLLVTPGRMNLPQRVTPLQIHLFPTSVYIPTLSVSYGFVLSAYPGSICAPFCSICNTPVTTRLPLVVWSTASSVCWLFRIVPAGELRKRIKAASWLGNINFQNDTFRWTV